MSANTSCKRTLCSLYWATPCTSNSRLSHQITHQGIPSKANQLDILHGAELGVKVMTAVHQRFYQERRSAHTRPPTAESEGVIPKDPPYWMLTASACVQYGISGSGPPPAAAGRRAGRRWASPEEPQCLGGGAASGCIRSDEHGRRAHSAAAQHWASLSASHW